MKKMKLLLLCLVAVTMGTKAQIGYQISLLNTATGEPRANEAVTVSVSLSNNANEVFYSETKSATTNDFGVLSLSIGNADMFANVDFSKMPFFIEVTANGVSIGKSQMLSVPVAEYAKRTGDLTKELLVGTWVLEYDYNYETTGRARIGWESDWEFYSYTYKYYNENREKFVFNKDNTGKFRGTQKYWVEGMKEGHSENRIRYYDREGYPYQEAYYTLVDADWNNEETQEYEYQWFIDGNLVYLIYNSASQDHNYTYTSSPYIDYNYRNLRYINKLGVLVGLDYRGFTKQ